MSLPAFFAHDTDARYPLQADVIDGGVVITGPDGFQSAMTVDAARATVARLQAVLGAAGEPQETYQKPLG